MPKSLLKPLLLCFTPDNATTQARLILKAVNDLHQEGYQQVGLTYSANRGQSVAIAKAYQADQWFTGTVGGNQAQVIAEVESLLGHEDYQHLRQVFRIFPITTCEYPGGAGRVKDEWLEDDLDRIRDFLAQDDHVLLGWQNQLTIVTPDRPFAVGGGISAMLTEGQVDLIQSFLKGLDS